MSQDEPKLSRKEKRAQRDAERFQKGKKRKHAETIDEPPAVPGDDNEDNELDKDFIALPKIDDNAPPSQKSSKSKKRKAEDEPSDTNAATAAAREETNGADGETQPKRKRRRKQKKRATNGEDGASEPAKHRFLLFIGNLPYNTTDDTLRQHFKKLEPFTLRHRIDPQTRRSKGFAFLEFENYDRMQTCLKLYHHSMFDPENAGRGLEAGGEEEAAAAMAAGKKAKGRRINVELTAGGGGANEARKEKIKAKNVRLEEQRKRRMEQERKEGERKERRQGRSGGGADAGKDGGAQAQGDRGGEVMGAMHPSRMARM